MLSRSVVSEALQAPLPMGILQARILERVAMLPPGHLPKPGMEPRSPTLQAESLLSEPPLENVRKCTQFTQNMFIVFSLYHYHFDFKKCIYTLNLLHLLL